MSELFRKLETCGKPWVSAINGTCMGGAFELSLACHGRVAADSDKVKMALPEVKVGIFPGAGATQRMPRNTSICLAKQYIFTGDFFDANTALNMGLINMVVPADEVMDQAKKMARKLSRKGPLALRAAKQSVNNSMNMDIKSGCRFEQTSWSMLFSSEDQKEGMKAFLEKRKPNFVGK